MVNNLRLIAELKQAAYAAVRHDYTETCLQEFAQWQRELKEVRRELFTVLTAHWREQSCIDPASLLTKTDASTM